MLTFYSKENQFFQMPFKCYLINSIFGFKLIKKQYEFFFVGPITTPTRFYNSIDHSLSLFVNAHK